MTIRRSTPATAFALLVVVLLAITATPAVGAKQTIEIVSLDAAGVPVRPQSESALSADGRYLVFGSVDALVPGDSHGVYYNLYRRDLVTGQIDLVSRSATGGYSKGSAEHPAVSGDGRYVAFESRATDLVATGSENGNLNDVFVRDMVARTTIRVSSTPNGQSTVLT